MNPESHDDWLDVVAARRLAQRERELLRDSMAGRPAEQRRLERELALNDLLDAHRPAPPVSSNFAALVMAEVSRSAPKRSPMSSVLEWLRSSGLPRMAAFAALALALGAGWWRMDSRRQDRMMRGAVEVARVSSGVDGGALADFELVRHLDQQSKPDDDALIVALAQ